MKKSIKLLVVLLALGAGLQAVLSYAETEKTPIESKDKTSSNKSNEHDGQPGP